MKISQKLLIILLIVSIFPVLIAANTYNREVAKNIDEKVNVFFKQIVEQNASYIEYEIKDIEKIMNFVISNKMIQDKLVDFNEKSGIEKVDSWLDISDVIEGTLLQSSNIQSVAFVVKDSDEFILFGDSTSEDTRAYYRFFRYEFDERIKPRRNNISWNYEFVENRNKLLVSRNLIHVNTGKHIGTVSFIVDIGNISDIITNANTGRGELVYMLDHHGNELGINNVSHTASRDKVIEIYGQVIEENRIFERPIVERSGIDYISKDEAIIYVLLKNGFMLISEVDISLLIQDIEAGRRTIYSLIIIGIIVALIMSFIFSKYVSHKFSQLIENMKLLQKGNFDIEKPNKSKGDEFVDINMFFYGMAKKLKLLIDMSYIQEIEKKEANLQALQNQINPHFLYNTLEVIHSMSVLGETEEIGEIAMRLGNLFRYNLSGKNIEFVSIEQELDHIKNYVYLMNIHYNNTILLFVECQKQLLKARIPRFILQPIIENSILHGFEHRKGEGVIEIEIKKDNNVIHIKVSDDGVGIKPENVKALNQKISLESDSRGSIGLRNINQRIKLAYGKNFGVQVDGEAGYLVVHVTIPYEESQ